MCSYLFLAFLKRNEWKNQGWWPFHDENMSYFLAEKPRNPSHRSQSVVFGSSRAWGQQKGRGALDVVIEVSLAMKKLWVYRQMGSYTTQLWLSCWCQLMTFLFVGFLFVLCLVSDEQMSNGWLFSLRNDKQMSNKGKGGFQRCKFFWVKVVESEAKYNSSSSDIIEVWLIPCQSQTTLNSWD